MGKGSLRRWRLWVVTGIVVAMLWVLYVVWRSPSSRRDDLATFGAFAVAVVILIPAMLAWARRKGKVSQSTDAAAVENLDLVANQLAVAVETQWKQEAEDRGLTGADPIQITWSKPSLPMAGRASAAAESRRFTPLPGLTATSEADLAGHTKELHALYGGLRSARLIIAGPPGSGKTGAAILLLLTALRHREQAPAQDRPHIPVPILITAQDWNPDRQPVADWLTRKLQVTYPPFTTATGTATAAALLAAGRIMVIIDGLDEISPDLRPVALQALSQQATFRLVILSRTSEMADAAARQGILHGAAAVELNPVDPADAASYLERAHLDPPPPAWLELTTHIRTNPASPLSQALNNPLALTLVRDTYQPGDSVRELLEFCDTLNGMPTDSAIEAITDHILDRVLPAAYTRHPGQPPLPYDLPTAQHTLTKIAAQMNQKGTRDLNWWEIPTWVPSTPRVTVSALAFGLAVGLAFGLPVGLASGLAGGLASGLGVGLAFGLICGIQGGVVYGIVGVGGARPRAMGDVRLSKALSKKNLSLSLWGGLVFGLAGGFGGGLAVGLAFALAGGFAGEFAVGFIDVIKTDPDSDSSLHPTTSWQGDRRYGLAVGLAVGLLVWLAVGLAVGLTVGLAVGLGGGLAFGLTFGLAVGLINNQCWAATLAFAQLANEWRTPVRLMKFLNDAHSRNILRAVGPSYQFRHARLQDRLVATGTASGCTWRQQMTAATPPPAGP